ncbi:MAG: T9SS type A sorting domain-containing protein [Bacteroidetes bacterium]|nr:T9SS type A sorting domain-containing protein [Bacteroidota bacterium]
MRQQLLGGLIFLGASAALQAQQAPQLSLLGRYESGIFAESAAEISAFDPASARLFIVNGAKNQVDLLDLTNPALPLLIDSIELGGNPNSVAVYAGVVAIAVEDPIKTNPGSVVFTDVFGTVLNSVAVGALPDMLTFTPNGQYVLVANEGEPNADYSIDPEGSVSIIDLTLGVSLASVATVDFTALTSADLDASTRVYGPGASIAQDFEPEYIAVSDNSKFAYVTLQENNALAAIDIENAALLGVRGLGFKDHSLPGQGLDASDRDDIINIANWPVFGMPLPDAIAFVRGTSGQGYLLTANEGDARDYETFAEESRIKDLTLDPLVFPNRSDLRNDDSIGRLTVTTTLGNADGNNEYEGLYVLGTRSFSVYDAFGNLVWDSGEDLEQITAAAYPADFNATNDENGSFDNRSDNKGPEPEGITVGQLSGRQYAFIGLERIGGVMVYDVTDPTQPEFVQYINTRDFAGDAEAGTAGDLGPEGLAFINPSESPTGEALLVVAYEVSGSVAIFRFGTSCGTPQNLEVAFPAAGTVAFNWDDVDGAFGYRLRLQRAGSPSSKVLASAISQRTVSGFIPGETYSWSVRAACAEDTSAYAALASFTLPVLREELVDANAALQVQPNPVADRLYLSGSVPATGTAELFATDGRRVAGPVQASVLQQGWDLSDLPAGAYLLRVQSEGSVQTLPVLRQ